MFYLTIFLVQKAKNYAKAMLLTTINEAHTVRWDSGDRILEDAVNVEDLFVARDVYMSNSGELFAPESTTIVVYDIKGRVVAMSETSRLNISSLNRGVYLVRSIYEDGLVQVTKVIL